jgi:hypothetical protein
MISVLHGIFFIMLFDLAWPLVIDCQDFPPFSFQVLNYPLLVGTVTCYRLDVWGSVLGRNRHFSLKCHIHLDLSNFLSFFLGLMQVGHDTDPVPRLRMHGALLLFSNTVIACCRS